MPLWLRRFTFNKLKEHYDKQKEIQDKQQNMLSNKSEPKPIARPGVTPNYKTSTKAPKK